MLKARNTRSSTNALKPPSNNIFWRFGVLAFWRWHRVGIYWAGKYVRAHGLPTLIILPNPVKYRSKRYAFPAYATHLNIAQILS